MTVVFEVLDTFFVQMLFIKNTRTDGKVYLCFDVFYKKHSNGRGKYSYCGLDKKTVVERV